MVFLLDGLKRFLNIFALQYIVKNISGIFRMVVDFSLRTKTYILY